jgi:hypothetical protein
MRIGNRHAAGMRTDHDAGQNIAQNQRLLESLCNQSGGERGHDNNNDVAGNSHDLPYVTDRLIEAPVCELPISILLI